MGFLEWGGRGGVSSVSISETFINVIRRLHICFVWRGGVCSVSISETFINVIRILHIWFVWYGCNLCACHNDMICKFGDDKVFCYE